MLREKELRRFPSIQFSSEISEEDLNIAYNKGMIAKKDLIDGKYYLGICRNTYVAQWIVGEGVFRFMRKKFEDIFPEIIRHPEDDNGYDLFIPLKEVEPHPDEVIQLPVYKSFVLHKKKQA